MHEYQLTLDIIEIAAHHAIEHNSEKVSQITLVIGESSGVMGESIKLYFDIIAEGTVCEGAEIEIETIKPMLKCKTCGLFFQRKPFSFDCTNNGCQGEGEPTEIGREFFVKNIVCLERKEE